MRAYAWLTPVAVVGVEERGLGLDGELKGGVLEGQNLACGGERGMRGAG